MHIQYLYYVCMNAAFRGPDLYQILLLWRKEVPGRARERLGEKDLGKGTGERTAAAAVRLLGFGEG